MKPRLKLTLSGSLLAIAILSTLAVVILRPDVLAAPTQLDAEVSEGSIQVKAEDEPARNDFQGTNQGTLVMLTNFNSKLFAEQNPGAARYVVFFKSERMEGMALGYDLALNRLVAGTPVMRSEEVSMDGAEHQVVYTFASGGRQAVFFDGKQVAESGFVAPSPITGFAAYEALEGAIELPAAPVFYNGFIRR